MIKPYYLNFMIKIKYTLICLLITAICSIAILTSCQKSFHQNIEIKSQPVTFKEKVDSIVASKMNEYNIPGISAGIVLGDSILYAKGYGVKEINSGGPVSEHTVFHTASISKIFTALAVVQLEREGKLSIGNKLTEFIPELIFRDKQIANITLKQLLNHTSGLPDVLDYHWEDHHKSENALSDYILGLDLQLENQPGTTYSYSNLGYDIMGLVVEKAAGKPFEDYVKENILDQAGMSNSDFRHFLIPDSLLAYPHSKAWLTNRVKPREIYPYTREHAPSSTLNASATDLSKWMILFMNEPKEYSKLITPSTELHPHIGLGFQIYSFDSYKTIGHYGGDKGFRSLLLMIPEKQIGIVILGNSDYNEDYRQEILFPIAKLML